MKSFLCFLLVMGPTVAFSSNFGEADSSDLSGLVEKNITSDTDCSTNKSIFSGRESKNPFLSEKEELGDGSKMMEIKK